MSDGVRGATINAIASSMPELFTTIFFLLYLKDTDGFSGGIGTTAGSAIFNGMIIPAVVIFAVLYTKIATEIKVSKKVILRDGLSLIAAETILIFLISGDTLNWWHGFILMITYGVYVTYMLTTMSTVESNEPDEEEEEEDELKNKSFFNSLVTLDLESLIIGKNKINNKNGWTLLIISMLVIGLACLILVAACEMIGSESYSLPFIGELNGLNIPIMFIAVVLASAATSVPDTIISVRDARNGNYNDAISNALGSNIFDVCFALGLPLFLYCLFYGPITMSPETVQFSSELRILLLIMTIIAFFVYIIGSRMTKLKGFILLTIYILFTIYIVGRSIDASWAQVVSDYLGMIYNFIT